MHAPGFRPERSPPTWIRPTRGFFKGHRRDIEFGGRVLDRKKITHSPKTIASTCTPKLGKR